VRARADDLCRRALRYDDSMVAFVLACMHGDDARLLFCAIELRTCLIDIQVQHLIEKCICYKLNKEECMETLEKHAKIMPVITSTGMLLEF
jgi:uncharacterized protein (TIGR01589 family)